MAFGFRNFYRGTDHSISDHLSTEQVKVCYSDKFVNQMFAIQIPTVHI